MVFALDINKRGRLLRVIQTLVAKAYIIRCGFRPITSTLWTDPSHLLRLEDCFQRMRLLGFPVGGPPIAVFVSEYLCLECYRLDRCCFSQMLQ